jgi:hypothetical protein
MKGASRTILTDRKGTNIKVPLKFNYRYRTSNFWEPPLRKTKPPK